MTLGDQDLVKRLYEDYQKELTPHNLFCERLNLMVNNDLLQREEASILATKSLYLANESKVAKNINELKIKAKHDKNLQEHLKAADFRILTGIELHVSPNSIAALVQELQGKDQTSEDTSSGL